MIMEFDSAPLKCLRPRRLQRMCYGKPFTYFVPCGHCEICLAKESNSWQLRLYEEMKIADNAIFLTLTYDDDHLPKDDAFCLSVDKAVQMEYEAHFLFDGYGCSSALDRLFHDYSVCDDAGVWYEFPCFAKRDVQLFMKRLRKECAKRGYKNVRYFCVSEYTPTSFRPHYHLILFNIPPVLAEKHALAAIWQNGFADVKPVTNGRITYVCKYVFAKMILPDFLQKPWRLMSTRPAIGYSWYDSFVKQLETKSMNETTYFKDGYSYAAPRYYKNRYKYLYEKETGNKYDGLAEFEAYVDSEQWIDRAFDIEARELQARAIENEAASTWNPTEAYLSTMNEELPQAARYREFKKKFWDKYYKTRKKSKI